MLAWGVEVEESGVLVEDSALDLNFIGADVATDPLNPKKS